MNSLPLGQILITIGFEFKSLGEFWYFFERSLSSACKVKFRNLNYICSSTYVWIRIFITFEYKKINKNFMSNMTYMVPSWRSVHSSVFLVWLNNNFYYAISFKMCIYTHIHTHYSLLWIPDLWMLVVFLSFSLF